MTIRELIEALKTFPQQDMLVLTDGYEGGYEHVMPPRSIQVEHVPENRYYDGEYQEIDEDIAGAINAVVVPRNRRDDEL
jgi:hypothetical protein